MWFFLSIYWVVEKSYLDPNPLWSFPPPPLLCIMSVDFEMRSLIWRTLLQEEENRGVKVSRGVGTWKDRERERDWESQFPCDDNDWCVLHPNLIIDRQTTWQTTVAGLPHFLLWLAGPKYFPFALGEGGGDPGRAEKENK